MLKFLNLCQELYTKGEPIISDAEFDYLAEKYKFYEVGYANSSTNQHHYSQMYSLVNVFDDDDVPFSGGIRTPKLDGAAISLLYKDCHLVQATTRGDGIVGEDITEHVIVKDLVPRKIKIIYDTQITGEVVASSELKNSRNYVSGALHLKDMEELKTRDLFFVAYGVYPNIHSTYTEDMKKLSELGFHTVLENEYCKKFPQDGIVYRIDSNREFNNLGYTSKHPRGAYAHKKKSDVEVKETKLLEVVWQVGSGGKVTPVAIFEEVEIDGANIQRATLHNAGFIENMDLDIGDTLLVTRSGGVIPKVIGKV